MYAEVLVYIYDFYGRLAHHRQDLVFGTLLLSDLL